MTVTRALSPRHSDVVSLGLRPFVPLSRALLRQAYLCCSLCVVHCKLSVYVVLPPARAVLCSYCPVPSPLGLDPPRFPCPVLVASPFTPACRLLHFLSSPVQPAYFCLHVTPTPVKPASPPSCLHVVCSLSHYALQACLPPLLSTRRLLLCHTYTLRACPPPPAPSLSVPRHSSHTSLQFHTYYFHTLLNHTSHHEIIIFTLPPAHKIACSDIIASTQHQLLTCHQL